VNAGGRGKNSRTYATIGSRRRKFTIITKTAWQKKQRKIRPRSAKARKGGYPKKKSSAKKAPKKDWGPRPTRGKESTIDDVAHEKKEHERDIAKRKVSMRAWRGKRGGGRGEGTASYLGPTRRAGEGPVPTRRERRLLREHWADRVVVGKTTRGENKFKERPRSRIRRIERRERAQVRAWKSCWRRGGKKPGPGKGSIAVGRGKKGRLPLDGKRKKKKSMDTT